MIDMKQVLNPEHIILDSNSKNINYYFVKNGIFYNSIIKNVMKEDLSVK